LDDRPPHRGFADNIAAFAHDFVTTRTTGFLKDMEICLTDTPNGVGGVTHAYFPALATCCAFLEYMTGLTRGKLEGIGWRDIAAWSSNYLRQPDYSKDTIRVLMEAFRNSVAHRGIATGIWCDRSNGGRETRRITWMLSETHRDPACQLIEEPGILEKDPPWPCPYTHRMHIYLRSLADDLAAGARQYAANLLVKADAQDRFQRAMRTLYPVTQTSEGQEGGR
jgi:hypothetical protein